MTNESGQFSSLTKKMDIFGSQSSGKKPDKAGEATADLFQNLFVLTGMGICDFFRCLWRNRIKTSAVLWLIFSVSWFIAEGASHLKLLHWMDPNLFTINRLQWFYRFTLNEHAAFLAAFICFVAALILGFRLRCIRVKYMKLFEDIGMITKLGNTPKLVHKRKLDRNRVMLTFDSKGIGINHYRDKTEDLESCFCKSIESIGHGKNQRYITITLTKKKLPEKVTYEEMLREQVLPEESFYIGMSSEGPLTQNIAELPHMLVAGSTGAGKSVFFKQALMGLLHSSRHLQMYLIDLKGGLEMVDFTEAPNVRVVKEMSDAVLLLGQIKEEMDKRFSYLEKRNLKQIVPKRDKRDRIVVAIDEASVLFMNLSKNDPDYKMAINARKLADSLAKLSRAAGINLLLATQKLDRRVLPTSVTENVSGRMAFKANSLQGSMTVLGSKDAIDLPEIKGRGIWCFGNRKIIAQAPYINEKSIRSFCEEITKDFKKGRRLTHGTMIGDFKCSPEIVKDLAQNTKGEKSSES